MATIEWTKICHFVLPVVFISVIIVKTSIAQDMFKLWTLAEQDLLEPSSPYTLKDTGQGLQRVQECPRISKAMREIVHRVQEQSGGWVGSSVVHLGDNNVPNSLIFIDKYGPLNYRTAARTLFLRPYLAHFCPVFSRFFAVFSVLKPGFQKVAPKDRGAVP